ncbi:MAG TPA: methyltransferase domain-containing protein [Ottowia sp.]|uniref:class I SAM-dependent methyltransferase n=1 Tax=Ottowia sp. TaxID=1898956 RepID=UPI002CC109B7|nr:methyltransferase domain-containing protein [Ottowia sp.]HMN19906.1 methyltransferase domain-containing protein [Ottowia sp.]
MDPHNASTGEFWDRQFSRLSQPKYGEQPNAFLAEQAARLAPGSRILVPGDGEGRNGVWLAGLGHAVTTVDASAVGIARARALAQRRGVALEAIQADLADWHPEPAGFDAVACIYLHLPSTLRTAVHRRLVQALRPGGLLILEAFHPDQLPLTSGGPKNPDMLYTLALLRQDFAAGMLEQLALETDTVLDEGSGHHGRAQVTRWVGQRNAAPIGDDASA